METTKIGKRGTVVIPAALRRRFGFTEGSLVIAEEQPEGVLLRPAAAVPIEIYSPERIAEFLLTNAVDEADYRRAEREVRALGLSPRQIAHRRPGAKK
jgi:AbrB family looped-hinge helix DNA binding protein